jgi:hypothetical protein
MSEELSPILEGALLQGLRDFGDKYDLSCQPDLYQCLQDCLRRALVNIKMDDLAADGFSGAKKKSRNTSGYNEYIKEAWAEYRTQKKLGATAPVDAADLVKTLPQETMSDFAKKWKSMKEADKKKYMDAANQKNTAAKTTSVASIPTKVARRRGPLSGYQFYIALDETKTKVPPGLTSMEQMSYKAKLWKALTESEQQEYKVRSEKTFWESNPDLYEQHQQEQAEKALKTVTQEKMVDSTKMPTVSLPVLKKGSEPLPKLKPLMMIKKPAAV